MHVSPSLLVNISFENIAFIFFITVSHLSKRKRFIPKKTKFVVYIQDTAEFCKQFTNLVFFVFDILYRGYNGLSF